MSRIRILLGGAVALAAVTAFLAFPHARASAQPGCAVTTYAKDGVVYRVLFAHNGAVQQYVLTRSSHNVERDHDALKTLEAKYGPAGVDAPPVKIVSFKPGPNGMMIPDKAVDSCGRVSFFH